MMFPVFHVNSDDYNEDLCVGLLFINKIKKDISMMFHVHHLRTPAVQYTVYVKSVFISSIYYYNIIFF